LLRNLLDKQRQERYEIVGVTGDNKFDDMHEEFLTPLRRSPASYPPTAPRAWIP